MTGRALPRLDRMAYGADWNPEQWPEPVWTEDLRLMQDAGVTLVTVGVFSWSLLEPEPGRYDFGWLDRVLDQTHEHGIAVDLATATASPPPWLGHRWPQTLPVTEEGVRLSYGARQQYCPSSPEYRARALALVERLGDRYGEHPSVVLWHVGNEYAAHTPACWCDTSAEAFRRWLAERYGDVAGLNAAWSTTFWSQRYSSFAEVLPPRRAPYFPNPAQQLDFRRFSSHALLELFVAERDTLRPRTTSDRPVTTNFMRLFKDLDYWRWAAEEDVVSDDWYPDLADPWSCVEGALGADLMRSLGGGRPWLLMEQAVSAINWRGVNPPKPPGAYRRWSLQQVARGADGVLAFQWRASQGGAEKWHSAMVPHPGPGTSTWDAVTGLGRELGALSPVVGSRVEADVALLLDWEAWWALELDSRPSELLRQKEQLLAWYRPLWESGVQVDLAHPEHDLSRYRLVLAPALYLVSDAGVASVRQALDAGSDVVLGPFSGAVDGHDRVRPGAHPGAWQDVIGSWVEEYVPLLPGDRVALEGEAAADDAHASTWTEAVHAVDSDVLLTYAAGLLEGRPAVTRRGPVPGRSGSATYVSCCPDPGTLATLLTDAVARSGLVPAIATVPGVEVTTRRSPGLDVHFLLNHTETDHTVTLPGAGNDLLTGDAVGPSVTVAAGGVQVVARVVDESRGTHPSPAASSEEGPS